MTDTFLPPLTPPDHLMPQLRTQGYAVLGAAALAALAGALAGAAAGAGAGSCGAGAGAGAGAARVGAGRLAGRSFLPLALDGAGAGAVEGA